MYPVTTLDGSDKSYSPFVISSNAFLPKFNGFDLRLFLSYDITLHPDCLLRMATHNLQLSMICNVEETVTEHIFTALDFVLRFLKIYTICTSCLWQKYVSKTDHVKKV